MLNDKRIKACMARFSSGAYTRMQFLSAVSHSMGAHTEALRPTETAAAAATRRKLRQRQQQRRQCRIHQPKRKPLGPVTAAATYYIRAFTYYDVKSAIASAPVAVIRTPTDTQRWHCADMVSWVSTITPSPRAVLIVFDAGIWNVIDWVVTKAVTRRRFRRLRTHSKSLLSVCDRSSTWSCGDLTALHHTPSWFWGTVSQRRKGKGREYGERRKEGKGRGRAVRNKFMCTALTFITLYPCPCIVKL